jgi:hypothetical protein
MMARQDPGLSSGLDNKLSSGTVFRVLQSLTIALAQLGLTAGWASVA